MEILTNATICDSKPTGLGVYTQNVILNSQNKEFDQTVLINKGIALKNIPQIKNLLYSPSSLLSSKGWKAQLLRIFYLNFKFLLNNSRFDYFLNTVPEGSLLIPRKKQITVIHDVLPILYREEYNKSYYYYKYYVPLLLKKSKHIVVPSENTKKDIISMYKLKASNIVVAPNGYDKSHFYPRTIEEINKVKELYKLDRYLLYVGNMYPHKNLNRVIEAFAKLNQKEVKFVIAGDKSHWNYKFLLESINKYGLKDQIEFLDYVSYEHLPILYSGAEAFVYPSVYEGFGLPVIEAMACGSPVITSNNSSLIEISDGAALNVDPLNVFEISEAMKKIIQNKDLKDKLKVEGINKAKEYSWERTTEIICSLFD